MKIATWNVNSIRVRLTHLLEWIEHEVPDLVSVQETKVTDESFPKSNFSELGYSVLHSGQKSYNGVAIFFKNDIVVEELEPPIFPDNQKRFMAINMSGVDFVNVYVPNGSSVGSDKYQYKLDWLQVLIDWLNQRFKKNNKIVLMGDFNIAPADIDVHDVERWKDKILCSEGERNIFEQFKKIGFCDVYRYLHPCDQDFTWWDYRLNGFARNWGLRIDHILTSSVMTPVVAKIGINKSLRGLDRPSDHALVWADLIT